MSGLVMETITHCEYCRNSIEWNDVKIETRVVYPYNSLINIVIVNNFVNKVVNNSIYLYLCTINN